MDVIQEAIDQKKHISTYQFGNDQTWERFYQKAAGRDVYLYGLGNAARYFIEKYSEKIELCGAIDAYVNLQDFCLGDYLPEAVETAYERIPIFDSTILKSLSPKKTLILISNINAYEEIARQMSLYHLECFVLLLMEADLRLCSSYCASYMEQEKQTEYTCRRSAYADRCCRLPIEKKK